MFEQAQIQEFKEVGGFGGKDQGSLMRRDLQLFPRCSQVTAGSHQEAARPLLGRFILKVRITTQRHR